MRSFEEILAVHSLLTDADHVDIKTAESAVNLREFIVGFISYYPAWVKFLYRVRQVFVRFLGMRQEGVPPALRLDPADVPMRRGEYLSFFKVKAAEEDRYWIASAADKHLTAYLAIVAEPGANGQTCYSVITVVKYHHWTGPVYFNVIRPFHHLVVGGMMQSAVKGYVV